ncbi:DNA-protecting protein DprA [Adhaeribacter sp. BT258]|uniref:DNA-protecting protein DprA n=2 Tax=Adhaeribacter terrigena TaxID=2793070 RepID=A0ABS1C0H5_9BACT|nr:DNA-processing protein DprA [Adhaeribacter terrigena]MBK0402910.1 DNA-protecting protein DprA [Adhaeribacter terrigena]
MLTKQLVSFCGSPKAFFDMPLARLELMNGIGPGALKAFKNRNEALRKAEVVLQQAEKYEAQILFYTHPDYPKRLKQIADAPSLLFYKGNASLNHPKTISIVGTRKLTRYGEAVTEKIVHDLQKHDPLIISGLAYGIDIVAHRSALKYGLQTIGTIASGLDMIYPAAHKKTAEQMLEQGGLLSEKIFGIELHPQFFPARNRIIAGLADCTIIVEGALKSGSLITAEIAYGYNKEVMAVPGNITSEVSGGTNYLIKTQQAVPYTCIEDLEQLLNWDNALQPPQLGLFADSPTKPNQLTQYDPNDFSQEEWAIIEVLQQNNDEMIDNISWKAQIPINQIASLLLNLEFNGVVKSLPGKKFRLL